MAIEMVRARRRAEQLVQAATFLCRSLAEMSADEDKQLNLFVTVLTRNFADRVELSGCDNAIVQRAKTSPVAELPSRSWVLHHERSEPLIIRISALQTMLTGDGGHHSVTLDLLVNVLALALDRTATDLPSHESTCEKTSLNHRGDTR